MRLCWAAGERVEESSEICLLAGLGDRLEFCLTGLGLTGESEVRGIVGISLGREGVVCRDSDRVEATAELFSEGDGEADSGLTVVSLAGARTGAGSAELSERPGVLGVLGVLGVRPP